MNYIIARLKEQSTYSGLLALLSALGLAIDPDQFAAISTALIAIVGVYETFRRER
jgi:hypothetical protein